MSDERRQPEINWTSGDKSVHVEWNPLRRWVKLQDFRTGEMMIVDPESVDGLIKALQAIKEKMSEPDP